MEEEEDILSLAERAVSEMRSNPFASPEELELVEHVATILERLKQKKRGSTKASSTRSSPAAPSGESEMCKCASTCTTSRKAKTLGLSTYSWCELNPKLLSAADQASFQRALENGIGCMTPSGRKKIQRYTGTSGANAKYFRECEPSNDEFLVRDGQSLAFTAPASNTGNLLWKAAKAVGATAAVGAALYAGHTQLDKHGVYDSIAQQAGDVSKTVGEYTEKVSDTVQRWLSGETTPYGPEPRPYPLPPPKPTSKAFRPTDYYHKQTPVGTLSPSEAAPLDEAETQRRLTASARRAEEAAVKARAEAARIEEAARVIVEAEKAKAQTLNQLAEQAFQQALQTKKEAENALLRAQQARQRGQSQQLVEAEERNAAALKAKFDYAVKRATDASVSATAAKGKAEELEKERFEKDAQGNLYQQAMNMVSTAASTVSDTWNSLWGKNRLASLSEPLVGGGSSSSWF